MRRIRGCESRVYHVTSHSLSLSLFGMILSSSALAILPIAIEGTFALVFCLFFFAMTTLFFFGFLFYGLRVGEQYARAARRIAADPAFVLALANAASKEV